MNTPRSSTALFTLPLFPLPLFLLPGGITRLRIFEPRYLKMVTIASQNEGFAIMLDSPVIADVQTSSDEESTQSEQWASWVEIINFDQGEDGILVIDVKCKMLLEVVSVSVDQNHLRFGLVKEKSHWLETYDDDVTKKLSYSLRQLFEEDTALKSLYQNEFITHPKWVLARWLELLPISKGTKGHFTDTNSFEQAKNFIASVVFEQNNH